MQLHSWLWILGNALLFWGGGGFDFALIDGSAVRGETERWTSQISRNSGNLGNMVLEAGAGAGAGAPNWSSMGVNHGRCEMECPVCGNKEEEGWLLLMID